MCCRFTKKLKQNTVLKIINEGGFVKVNDMAKERVNWIDYAKGIGIILVVIGHGWVSDTSMLSIWIYSFHMPLFFIISGMLIKDNTLKLPTWQIVKKYAKSILLPYYIFSLFIILVEICKDILKKDFTLMGVIRNIGKSLFLQGIQAEWFLPCLFVAVVCVCFILKKIKCTKVVGLVLLVIALILCGFVHIDNTNFAIDELIVLLRSCVALLFVYIGYVFRGGTESI
jgi:fucose 4-O-acetylase-like acetyltransferase